MLSSNMLYFFHFHVLKCRPWFVSDWLTIIEYTVSLTVVAHAFNPITREACGEWVWNPSTRQVETEESGVQGHLWLYSEFEASFWHMRSSMNKQTNKYSQAKWLVGNWLSSLLTLIFLFLWISTQIYLQLQQNRAKLRGPCLESHTGRLSQEHPCTQELRDRLVTRRRQKWSCHEDGQILRNVINFWCSQALKLDHL